MRRFFCVDSSAEEASAGNALVSGFSAGAGFLVFSVLPARLAGTFIPDFGAAFEAVADSLEGKAAVSGAFVVALAVALVVRLTAFAVVFLTALVAFTVAFAVVFVALAALAVVLAGAFVAFGFAESVAAALVFAVAGLAVAVAVGLPSALSVFCATASLVVCVASFGLSAGLLAVAVACAFFMPALTS